MNFSLSEFSLGRQRCRQWVPLITQQLRLRHVYQILAFNMQSERKGSFYFTLHLTLMSSPFYSSEKIECKNPKWAELSLSETLGASSAVVIRVWQENKTGINVVLTWGVNFSGLTYLGNKLADLQPGYFESNTVIFFMQGGYFTSHNYLRNNVEKPVPFAKNLNLIGKILYRRIAIRNQPVEVQASYSLDKLRRLHDLQLQIRNKRIDVQNVKEKIKNTSQSSQSNKTDSQYTDSNYSNNIRFAPQLLTMNSLNKMLHEKPTKSQREEMTKISKKIEVKKFEIRTLYQERDKKKVFLRQLRQTEDKLLEDNEEKNSDLMARYHILNRDLERLKEYKKQLLNHRELYKHIGSQLHHRQKQLLKELLFIYPIERGIKDKYTILGVHLPNSDVLAEYTDTGLSIALGFVTHILLMCSIFLQVPLRYPMIHSGSRSVIIDQISSVLPDREREFPLFTGGKEKIQFSYAVYLLNKNLAQFRWLVYMNTSDLKATLPNLLQFLQGGRDRPDTPILSSLSLEENSTRPPEGALTLDKWVSLSAIGAPMCSSVNDPILESLRLEARLQQRPNSPKNSNFLRRNRSCDKKNCGKGLSEILAIPEAYLNRQISEDLFQKIVSTGTYKVNGQCDDSCSFDTIKVKEGTEENGLTSNALDSIEQGTDSLTVITKSIEIHSKPPLDLDIKQNRRISRSVGSYTDEESSRFLKSPLEVGSDPAISDTSRGQQQMLETWLDEKVMSNESSHSEELLSKSVGELDSPLTARTDRLLAVTSFNLVKPKQ